MWSLTSSGVDGVAGVVDGAAGEDGVGDPAWPWVLLQWGWEWPLLRGGPVTTVIPPTATTAVAHTTTAAARTWAVLIGAVVPTRVGLIGAAVRIGAVAGTGVLDRGMGR